MFLKGHMIDSAVISSGNLNSPGHIESIKLDFEEKYEDIIEAAGEEPQYFLDNIPSRMNYIQQMKFRL